MTMVVGLISGKEFVTKDESYLFGKPDGSVYHVFHSADEKRLITIDHEKVEYIDEVATERRLKQLSEAANSPIEENKSVGDVNVG